MLDEDDRALLERMGLAGPGDAVEFEPLTGGVSSDIRLVRIGGRAVVLKRALATLKVATRWEAPIERGEAEARWLAFAGSVVPDAVPAVLAIDEDSYAMALEYLPAERFRNWKDLLLVGDIDVETAEAVGRLVGRIHAASAAADVSAQFENRAMFESLRIEPYLRRSAVAVPEAAAALAEVIAMLEAPGRALVHGDVSPKNILIGPTSPVLLDAECATWSDPAFDAAFVLTHLALKAEHRPGYADRLRAASAALRAGYLAEAGGEDAAELSGRIDRLIPALALARVAGASPVEYLDEPTRVRVRARAVAALRDGTPYPDAAAAPAADPEA